jgi:hypothetical protein
MIHRIFNSRAKPLTQARDGGAYPLDSCMSWWTSIFNFSFRRGPGTCGTVWRTQNYVVEKPYGWDWGMAAVDEKASTTQK